MTISIGVLSALVMEGLKWLYRKFVAKDMEYDFPELVYIVVLAALSVLLIPVMALLGQEEYQMPTNWFQWALDILMAVIGALGTYYVALSPLKSYRKARLAAKNGDG